MARLRAARHSPISDTCRVRASALLLGGPRRGIAFDPALAQALADGIARRLRAEGGSVLATASRRTPPAFAARLREALRVIPRHVLER